MTGTRKDLCGAPFAPQAQVGSKPMSAESEGSTLEPWTAHGRWFWLVVAAFLATSAGLKLLSLLLESKVLAATDPLVGFLSVRQMMFAAAVMELGVARIVWKRDPSRAAPWLVLWLVGVFGTYRLGLWTIGFRGHCSCLGHLFDWLPGFDVWADRLTLTSLVVMAVGSIWFLWLRGCTAPGLPAADSLTRDPAKVPPYAPASASGVSRWLNLLLVSILAWLVGNAVSVRAASPFRAEGSVSIYYLGEDPSNWVMGHDFTLWVSNQCWLARARPVHPEGMADVFAYFEAGFDGQELRGYIRHKDKEPPSGTGRNTGTAERYTNQQLLHEPMMPYFDVIWLALASGAYLQGADSNHIEPAVTFALFTGASYHEQPLTCPARWTLHPEPPHVPLTFVQIDPATNVHPRLRHRMPKPPVSARPFTNAVYRAIHLTNWAGLTVPLEAELTTFRDVDGELMPSHLFTVKVRSVSVAEEPVVFSPHLDGLTLIADNRFHHEARTVQAMDSKWPSDAAMTNTERFRRQAAVVEETRARKEGSRTRALLARSVLITVFAVPLVLMARKRLRRFKSPSAPKNNTTQQEGD